MPSCNCRLRVMLGYFPLLLVVAVLSIAVGLYDITLVKVGVTHHHKTAVAPGWPLTMLQTHLPSSCWLVLLTAVVQLAHADCQLCSNFLQCHHFCAHTAAGVQNKQLVLAMVVSGATSRRHMWSWCGASVTPWHVAACVMSAGRLERTWGSWSASHTTSCAR